MPRCKNLFSALFIVPVTVLACAASESPPTATPETTAPAAPAAAPAPAPAPPPAASVSAPAPTANPEASAKPKRAPARTPDVVYVPTPGVVVDKMLEWAKPKKTELLYDLGCGDGRIVVAAAKKFGMKAVGYDIDPQRVEEALENVRKNGVEDLVTIEEKDIFTLDLSPADVVTLYLLPELNVRLVPQLEKLKRGARVVTHDYDIAGYRHDKHVTLGPLPEDNENHEVYLFTMPLKKAAKK
jgi:SAM-dependent methyltransferase